MTVRETWFLAGFGLASLLWFLCFWAWARAVRRELRGPW